MAFMFLFFPGKEAGFQKGDKIQSRVTGSIIWDNGGGNLA
jgi:hypothetical protein